MFFAILFSILWVSVTIADAVNASNFSGKTDGRLKMYLALAAAMFWAIVMRYGG